MLLVTGDWDTLLDGMDVICLKCGRQKKRTETKRLVVTGPGGSTHWNECINIGTCLNIIRGEN